MAAPTPSIEKLQKKLEKEPNSLIFLQLADEYRKESLYDDALRTCGEGLRRHPNYWSARVAMGRIYHEMGDNEKAREELEKVIKAVPDNLLANKLLGDIYMESGRFPDALKRYQLVQMLTPNDQEIVANLQKIEEQLMAAREPQPPAAPAPVVVPPPPVEVVAEVAPAPTLEIPPPDVDVPPPVVVAPPAEAIEVPSFLEKTEPGVRSGGLDYLDSTMPQERVTMPLLESAQPNLESAMPQSFTPEPDLESMFLESAHSNEIPAASPFSSADDEHFPPFAPGNAGIASSALNPPPVSGQRPRPEDHTQPMQGKDDTGEFDGDELTTLTLAELYVQQGLTDKAVRVFQKMLLNDPGNPQIAQRLRELSPADSLLSLAASPEREPVPESQSRGGARDISSVQAGGRIDQQSDDRRRKITTLENWLATIRRER